MMIPFKFNFVPIPVLFILLLISVLLIFFLQIDRNNLKTQFSNNQLLLNSFLRDSDSRSQLEGKELYKLINIPKDTLLSVLKTSGEKYSIFFIVDSIDCYSCFQFHIKHINEFSTKNISIISYSNLHSKFLTSSLIKSINFPAKEKYKRKIINNFNMVIMLLNNEGRIIYADVADKTNYKKSKKFYSKINSFISNE